jgi:hypothetical protein
MQTKISSLERSVANAHLPITLVAGRKLVLEKRWLKTADEEETASSISMRFCITSFDHTSESKKECFLAFSLSCSYCLDHFSVISSAIKRRRAGI